MTEIETPNSAATTVQKRAWSNSFNWIGYVGLMGYGACVVASMALGARPIDGNLAGYIAGYTTAAFLISALLSWLAYLVMRRRAGASNVTLALLLLLFGWAMVDKARSDSALERWEEKTTEYAKSNVEVLERSLGGEDVSAELSTQYHERIEEMEQLAERTTGTDAKIVEVMAGVLRELEMPMGRYNDAAARFSEAGGIDPATISEQSQIVTRLELLNRFGTANDEFARTFAGLEASMRTQLVALNLTPRMIDDVIRGWRDGAQPELAEAMRQTDRDLVASYRGLLEVLNTEFGKWTLNEQGVVLFEDTVAAESYNGHFEDMIRALEEQERVQRQILEVTQRRAQSMEND